MSGDQSLGFSQPHLSAHFLPGLSGPHLRSAAIDKALCALECPVQREGLFILNPFQSLAPLPGSLPIQARPEACGGKSQRFLKGTKTTLLSRMLPTRLLWPLAASAGHARPSEALVPAGTTPRGPRRLVNSTWHSRPMAGIHAPHSLSS